MSRPCCLPHRLICTSGCCWCSRLLNVSFGPSAWFSLSLFLFIYLIYQFVTQMNNGWGGLLPRRHAKLMIVTRSLTKLMSTILFCLRVTPPPPILDDTRFDVSARSVSAVIESWQPCTSRHWSGRSIRKWHIEIYMSMNGLALYCETEPSPIPFFKWVCGYPHSRAHVSLALYWCALDKSHVFYRPSGLQQYRALDYVKIYWRNVRMYDHQS